MYKLKWNSSLAYMADLTIFLEAGFQLMLWLPGLFLPSEQVKFISYQVTSGKTKNVPLVRQQKKLLRQSTVAQFELNQIPAYSWIKSSLTGSESCSF